MRRHTLACFAIGLFVALLTCRLPAADSSEVEAKLREALRNTMLQLRDVQGQVATLQAAQAEKDQKNEELAAQVEALTTQASSDRETAKKKIADLEEAVKKGDAQVLELEQSLAKWKVAAKQAADIARQKESERARLDAEAIRLRRVVADQQTANIAMLKIANEILERYKKFSLGDALLAREPFVGITRVKLQNLVQDYSDQLLDQRIKPEPPAQNSDSSAADSRNASSSPNKPSSH